MALWVCRQCGTTFAVGLHCCPQCTATDCEEYTGMAKIRTVGGLTEATVKAVVPTTTKEDSWPGSSSSTSPVKPQKSAEPAKPKPRKRARTTGSRSRQARAGSSSASSTGTSTRETES